MSAGSSRPLRWRGVLQQLLSAWLVFFLALRGLVTAMLQCVTDMVILTISSWGEFAYSSISLAAVCLHPLLWVNCRMLGFKGTALLDSGATHCFVSRRWVLQHGLESRLSPIDAIGSILRVAASRWPRNSSKQSSYSWSTLTLVRLLVLLCLLL